MRICPPHTQPRRPSTTHRTPAQRACRHTPHWPRTEEKLDPSGAHTSCIMATPSPRPGFPALSHTHTTTPETPLTPRTHPLLHTLHTHPPAPPFNSLEHLPPRTDSPTTLQKTPFPQPKLATLWGRGFLQIRASGAAVRGGRCSTTEHSKAHPKAHLEAAPGTSNPQPTTRTSQGPLAVLGALAKRFPRASR